MNFFDSLHRCYLIAEIGVNHNGDMELCREMIDAAREAGADAVKFQTFTAQALVTRGTPKVSYQESATDAEESHYDMIRKLELSREDHVAIRQYCENLGIAFLSTPYDVESARFLESVGVGMYKTASADIVDLPLQEWIAATGKPAIVSTGMATLGEVEAVVQIYRRAGNDDLILLHCVSGYPCSDASLNLRVMRTLSEAFAVPVGYSDHSRGYEAAVLSIALGARVIEKHFTVNKSLPGPDHKASSTPEEFADLARAVRRAEVMLGSPVKERQEEERQMASVSRKSIVVASRVLAGETIRGDHLTLKRPGTGMGAAELIRVIGRRAGRDLEPNHLLRWQDME
jgi:N-acetylneuraminate synthase/N,N'-diacetyllegionaminate synthase